MPKKPETSVRISWGTHSLLDDANQILRRLEAAQTRLSRARGEAPVRHRARTTADGVIWRALQAASQVWLGKIAEVRLKIMEAQEQP